MQKSGKGVRFFWRAGLRGADIAQAAGFYDVQAGWNAMILAGGTSGMKTAVLRQVGETLETEGEAVERLYNTYDAALLDGLRLPERHTCVLDGARFGGYAPSCPGIGERIVGMDDCLDAEKLAPFRARVLIFHARQLSAEDRARKFMAAAANLLTDNTRLALECVDLAKLDASAAHFAQRLFSKSRRQGTETVRFLTAVTADGIENFTAQAADGYANVCILEDAYGIGKLLLGRLRDKALQAGQHVITCPCALFPNGQPEHLLFPDVSAAFFTANRFHPVEGFRHIHMRRYLDHEALAKGKARAAFNRKAARELLKQASLLLGEARENRRFLEDLYGQALKEHVLDALAEHITAETHAENTGEENG